MNGIIFLNGNKPGYRRNKYVGKTNCKQRVPFQDSSELRERVQQMESELRTLRRQYEIATGSNNNNNSGGGGGGNSSNGNSGSGMMNGHGETAGMKLPAAAAAATEGEEEKEEKVEEEV